MRLLFALVLALWPVALVGQTLPDPLGDTVSDYADILPPDVAARVSDTLREGRDETGVHVVLVAMDRISDHGGAGQRIEDYAKRLFNQWGIGDATHKDGILILVAREDRAMRIALGAGYEVIWDNAAQRVIDRAFLPAFRNDDYAGGIETGVAATFELVARPFAKGATTPREPATTWIDLAPIAVFGLIFTALVGMATRTALGDALVRFRQCPTCGRRSLTRHRDVVQPASISTSGHGLMHTHCAACGWGKSAPYSIARLSTKSGSSGGFGGGSSSGGGATGRW